MPTTKPRKSKNIKAFTRLIAKGVRFVLFDADNGTYRRGTFKFRERADATADKLNGRHTPAYRYRWHVLCEPVSTSVAKKAVDNGQQRIDNKPTPPWYRKPFAEAAQCQTEACVTRVAAAETAKREAATTPKNWQRLGNLLEQLTDKRYPLWKEGN